MEEHLVLLQVEQGTNMTPLEEILSLSGKNCKSSKGESEGFQYKGQLSFEIFFSAS